MHVPKFVVNAALRIRSPDGRSYAERIEAVRTERELSAVFEDFIAMVPAGKRLFGGLTPVETGGPMPVRLDFAAALSASYPHPLEGSTPPAVFPPGGARL